MGLFESSLCRMGLNCQVLGSGVSRWRNSLDKPRSIAAALSKISTPYVLYADSRDAILVRPPAEVLERFTRDFSCDLLFGGDRMSYPPDPILTSYENSLPKARASEFRYLNAGAWIGKTAYACEFFQSLLALPLSTMAPDSEQAIIRRQIQSYPGSIEIDYFCRMFLNIGFLFENYSIEISE